MLGPGFSARDERRGGPATAIVSYGVWRDLFGADHSVLGQPLLVNGKAFTLNLIVRTTLPADEMIARVRAELRQIDPAMPLYNVRTLAEHVNRWC